MEYAAPLPALDPALFAQAIANDYDYMMIAQDPLARAQLKLTPQATGLLQREDGTCWVPDDDLLHFKLTLEAHEPPFAGHFGQKRTEDEVRKNWW